MPRGAAAVPEDRRQCDKDGGGGSPLDLRGGCSANRYTAVCSEWLSVTASYCHYPEYGHTI